MTPDIVEQLTTVNTEKSLQNNAEQDKLMSVLQGFLIFDVTNSNGVGNKYYKERKAQYIAQHNMPLMDIAFKQEFAMHCVACNLSFITQERKGL